MADEKSASRLNLGKVEVNSSNALERRHFSGSLKASSIAN